jgi:hypothetical protein
VSALRPWEMMRLLLGAHLLTIVTINGRLCTLFSRTARHASWIGRSWRRGGLEMTTETSWGVDGSSCGGVMLHGDHGASMAAMSGQDRCHKIMSMCGMRASRYE